MDNIISSLNYALGFNERKKKSAELLSKHPHQVPIILYTNIKSNIEIVKNKYLVSKNVKFSQFMIQVRKHIKINFNESIFFLVNNKIMLLNELVETLYNNEKSADGFLYIYICKESTYG
jgi:GABA(A) receptor-associated protein